MGDAFDLVPRLGPMPHVFTSLPDAAEVGVDLPAWVPFFHSCVQLVLDNLEPAGFAVFYQTDRRTNGMLYDKGAMVASEAVAWGARVVWHKIAVKTLGTNLRRPSFAHLVAVSAKGTAGHPTPDVFMAGAKAYADATDTAALAVVMDFLSRKGATQIFDPFAGRGSIGQAAALWGIGSVSIDIDPAQVEAARAAIGSVR